MNKKQKKVLVRILLSVALLAAVWLLFRLELLPDSRWLRLGLYLIPYLVIGYDILLKAARGVRNAQPFDENFLMAVATIGAMALGEYLEGAAVMLFYQIGELFQSYAVGKSRRSIGELMDIRPDYANVTGENGELEQVDPDEVPVGTVIWVTPGEKIPIDAVVEEGESSIDTAALTGESVPRDVFAGDEVVSGCINLSGLLKLRTTREFGESTASKILGKRVIPEGKSEEYAGQYDIYGTVICFVDSNGKVAVLPNYVPEMPEPDNGRKDFYSYCTLGTPVMNRDGNFEVLVTREASWYVGPDAVFGNTEYYQDNYYTRETRTEYVILSADGTELSRATVNITPGDAYLNISEVAAGPDGSILVTMDRELLCIGKDGAVLWTVSGDNTLTGVYTLADGTVAVTGYESSDLKMLRTVNFEKHSLEDSRSIPESVWSPVPGNGDYDLYYSSGFALYGLRIGETPERILDWLDCDINGQTLDAGALSISADGTVRGLVSDYVGEREVTQLFTVTRAAEGSMKAKGVLTMAQLQFYPDYTLVNRVLRFNRSHDDVRIAFRDYSVYNTEYDQSVGLNYLLDDILSGNAPDIIPMDDLPYRQLAFRGLLEDLYPFLDADRELNRGDFFPNVLAALECGGGLYQALPGFTVNTVGGPASLVGASRGWTYDGFNAAWQRMPAGSTVLEPYVTQYDALTAMLSLNFDRFVNWETGEADFESDEFKQLLGFVRIFPEDYNWEDGDMLSTDERIALGRQMLLQSFLYSPDSLLWNDVGRNAGNYTYVGWPVAEGVGSMLRPDGGFALSSRCPDKDAAWEFLRGLLTEAGQQEIGTLPTNRKVFDARLQDLMTVEYLTNSDGSPLLDANGLPVQKSLVSWFDEDGTEHSISAMSQAEADEVLSIIESSTRLAGYDGAIFDIVYEEAQAFFDGARSVDDAARLIQSRVGSYMSEQLFRG